jgi:hypothetical protein
MIVEIAVERWCDLQDRTVDESQPRRVVPQ